MTSKIDANAIKIWIDLWQEHVRQSKKGKNQKNPGTKQLGIHREWLWKNTLLVMDSWTMIYAVCRKVVGRSELKNFFQDIRNI